MTRCVWSSSRNAWRRHQFVSLKVMESVMCQSRAELSYPIHTFDVRGDVRHLIIVRWKIHDLANKIEISEILLKIRNIKIWNFKFEWALRRCETPPSPPTPDPVGIENCKQLFSPLLAFITQKIATHNTDIISALCVAFSWVVNASRNEKSCYSFWYRPRYFTCS